MTKETGVFVRMEDLYMSVGAMKDQKPKAEGSTRLAHTGLLGGLEHLKVETRLMDERFASVMGECGGECGLEK